LRIWDALIITVDEIGDLEMGMPCHLSLFYPDRVDEIRSTLEI